MLKFKSVIIVILVAVTAHGLPSYVKQCQKNEKLNECILEKAKVAVAQIMKGDASFGIPNLSAYNPTDQVLNVTENFIYTLENITAVSGELVPTSAKMDLNSLILEITMHMPFLVWNANFTAKGNDFYEKGHVTIKFDDLKFNYKKQFEEIKIDDKLYYQIESLPTTGSIKSIELSHEYDEETNVIGQGKLDALLPKTKDAIEGRLREMCAYLVKSVMNLILRTTTKDKIFID